MAKKQKAETSEKLLTDVELELMTILWRRNEASVNEVLELLSPSRDLAYTSVSTILRILEQKGIVKTRKEGRGHIYIPVLKKSEFEKRTINHIVERVFDGTPLSLVKQLLGGSQFSESELAEIRKLLEDDGGKS